MKTIKVIVHLTNQELATIKWIGALPSEYIRSIVHYDLEKIMSPEVRDTIEEENQVDKSFL